MNTIKKLQILFIISILFFSKGIYGKIITGSVIETDSQKPVNETIILILNTDNEIIKMGSSDSTGFFVFSQVQVDSFNVQIKRLGYEDISGGPFYFDGNEEFQLDVELTPLSILSESVTVTGKRIENTLKMVGFYDRKETGSGHTIIYEDIERLRSMDAVSVFRNIPRLKVSLREGMIMDRESQLILYSSRSFTSQEEQPLIVYLDNMFITLHDELMSINPNDIAGIEYYESSLEAPSEYVKPFQNTGVLLIWTKQYYK